MKIRTSIYHHTFAFAQMYKKAKNMDIFDFILMFSEKYKIFKNQK